MKINTKIKKLREMRNYTQSYMANKLALSQPSYSRIENGSSDLTLMQLINIAELFGMKIEDIIYLDAQHIFNNHGTFSSEPFSVNNQLVSDCERLLYEKTIKLLEEKVERYEVIISELKQAVNL